MCSCIYYRHTSVCVCVYNHTDNTLTYIQIHTLYAKQATFIFRQSKIFVVILSTKHSGSLTGSLKPDSQETSDTFPHSISLVLLWKKSFIDFIL